MRGYDVVPASMKTQFRVDGNNHFSKTQHRVDGKFAKKETNVNNDTPGGNAMTMTSEAAGQSEWQVEKSNHDTEMVSTTPATRKAKKKFGKAARRPASSETAAGTLEATPKNKGTKSNADAPKPQITFKNAEASAEAGLPHLISKIDLLYSSESEDSIIDPLDDLERIGDDPEKYAISSGDPLANDAFLSEIPIDPARLTGTRYESDDQGNGKAKIYDEVYNEEDAEKLVEEEDGENGAEDGGESDDTTAATESLTRSQRLSASKKGVKYAKWLPDEDLALKEMFRDHKKDWSRDKMVNEHNNKFLDTADGRGVQRGNRTRHGIRLRRVMLKDKDIAQLEKEAAEYMQKSAPAEENEPEQEQQFDLSEAMAQAIAKGDETRAMNSVPATGEVEDVEMADVGGDGMAEIEETGGDEQPGDGEVLDE